MKLDDKQFECPKCKTYHLSFNWFDPNKRKITENIAGLYCCQCGFRINALKETYKE